MKTRIFILLSLFAIVFTSCNINGSTNTTPEILFVTNPFVTQKDTLKNYLTDDGVYHLDTINVGDTVTFRLIFYGFSNNLSTCNISQSDTTSTKLLFPSVSSLDSVFVASASDYSIGKFIFKSRISSLYFPFKYVAKKVSNDASITFNLSSDANFSNSSSLGNNSVSFVLKTPIKLRKQI